MINELVRHEFHRVCSRCLKGLVSYARKHRQRRKPRLIGKDLWNLMNAYWDTDEAIEKSKTASESRCSERESLGMHKHVAGPRAFAEIEEDKEQTLGRHVSIGEVFMKTHTNKDGTYVDAKAKLIGEAYEKTFEEKLSQRAIVSVMASYGSSQPPDLTKDELNDIFIQSTLTDERGNPYGLGSLSFTHGKGKDMYTSSSSTIINLQEQLKAAQLRIEAQDSENRIWFNFLSSFFFI